MKNIYCVTNISSDSSTMAEILIPISEKPEKRNFAGGRACIGSRGNAGNPMQGGDFGQRRKDDMVNTKLIRIQPLDSKREPKSHNQFFGRQSGIGCCRLHVAKYFFVTATLRGTQRELCNMQPVTFHRLFPRSLPIRTLPSTCPTVRIERLSSANPLPKFRCRFNGSFHNPLPLKASGSVRKKQ